MESNTKKCVYYQSEIDEKASICPICKKKQKKKKCNNEMHTIKSKFSNASKIMIVIIAFLTIGIIVESIFIIKKLDYMDALIRRIEELENSYEYLSDDWWNERKENMVLKDKSDFMDEHIVFILDGYGNYYYTYDCMEEVTEGKEYSFWAYNKEQAVSKGYKSFKCSN